MRVKLLKDVVQGGRVKQSRRGGFIERLSADGVPLEPDYVASRNHADVSFTRGAEVEVSDATGCKWIKLGLACEVGSAATIEQASLEDGA